MLSAEEAEQVSDGIAALEAKVESEETPPAQDTLSVEQRLSAQETENKALKDQLSNQQAELDRRARELRTEKTAAKLDKLCEDGRLLPRDKAETLAMLLDLSAEKATKWIDFLSKQPAKVDFAEYGSASGVADSSPDAQFDAKVKEYQTKNPGTTYGQAFDAVSALEPGLADQLSA
jgi:hypothetical protein